MKFRTTGTVTGIRMTYPGGEEVHMFPEPVRVEAGKEYVVDYAAKTVREVPAVPKHLDHEDWNSEPYIHPFVD